VIPDVLYRCKLDKRNETLRYSLRSLRNIPHGEVFMVGDPPPWVTNVTCIPGSRGISRWHVSIGHLYLAARAMTGRRLLLVDDDTFIVAPLDSVPPLHAGLLEEHMGTKPGSYRRTFEWTLGYLREQGIEQPLSYERHVPMPMEADVLVEALAPVYQRQHPLQARSVYGNLARLGGEYAEDVKVDGEPMPSPFLSVHDRSWQKVWRTKMMAMFPDQSEYEQ
jgi:hypothetical protein